MQIRLCGGSERECETRSRGAPPGDPRPVSGAQAGAGVTQAFEAGSALRA